MKTDRTTTFVLDLDKKTATGTNRTVWGNIVEWQQRPGLWIHCTVTDVRVVFGRQDYLLVPLTGRGEVWVSAESITSWNVA